MIDYKLQILLEYMSHKYNVYGYDLDLVKNRIQIFDLFPYDLYDFVVASTRLDTASTIFREIREILR